MMRNFRKLCERHRHRIYTFACYYLGNREDAEDVVQEVLLRLWSNWNKLEPYNLPAWITRVTRNVCLDTLRKRQRYRALVTDESIVDSLSEEADGEPDAEALVDAHDLRQQLERAIERLDDPFRSIIILREIQGMKYQQIAEALNLPLNTVSVYLHRARKILRDRLRKEMNHD